MKFKVLQNLLEDYGYEKFWIDSVGKVIYAKGSDWHIKMLQKLFNVSDDEEYNATYNRAFNAGWIRGNVQPTAFSVEFPKENVSRKALNTLFEVLSKTKEKWNYWFSFKGSKKYFHFTSKEKALQHLENL